MTAEGLTREESLALWCSLDDGGRAEFLRVGHVPPTAGELILAGWRAVYSDLYGVRFVESLGSHHEEAIEWHWDSRTAFLVGERPQYLAYFPIWSRGNMKSYVAERIVTTDAFLSAYFGEPGFCLYVTRNKQKTLEHVGNIEKLLSSAPVRRHFPGLSEVERNEETNQKRQWTGTFLRTKARYAVKGGSLESGLAGSRVDDTRPTLIIPDDIDDREDSEVIAENRFRQLTTGVLPMRQANTLVFFAQNLISRFSVMYRIHKGHARVLTNRKPTKPVPAVRDLVTKTVTVDGIVKDVYVSGTPTWPAWDGQRIDDEIQSEGLPAFLRECQHEVEESKEGVVLQNWDDLVHVISESQFASVFGTKRPPQRWWKFVGHDWSRTKTERHANVALTVTVSGEFEKLPGCHFLFDPMSFKANTQPENVALRLIKRIAPETSDAEGHRVRWDSLVRDSFSRQELEKYLADATALQRERRAAYSKVIPKYVTPVLRAQNYVKFRGSHEQANDALRVYKESFGLPFSPTNPGADGGVEYLNSLMKVDYSLPHPFNPALMGYTRFFLVVPDDRTATPVVVDGSEVYPPAPYNDALSPDLLHDHELARYQFRNWRFPDPKLTEAGEVEKKPLKANDDYGNSLMMLYHDRAVQAAPLNRDEQIISKMPEKVQPAQIAKVEDPHERAKLLTAQAMQRTKIENEMRRPRQHRDPVGAWRGMGSDRRRR